MNYPTLLTDLRILLKEQKVDAYIIGTADPHQSEYPPTYWAGRSWISGFTGSAGTVIITDTHAGLWTDARYFLQAEMQLKQSGFTLHKLLVQTQAEYLEWLCQELKPGQTVGCDFLCFSLNQIDAFDKILKASNLILKDTGDLLRNVWKNRPELSNSLITEHALKYAGVSRELKLEKVREEMRSLKVNWMLVSALDEIAYVLNLRGKDVHCNPVFVAYLMVGLEESILFVNEVKLSKEIISELSKAKISLKPYDQISLHVNAFNKNEKIIIDSSTLNAKLSLALPSESLVSVPSCIMKQKSIKNEIEMGHIRSVMAKDGAALVQAFIWLEETLKDNKTPSEYDFAKKIGECRALKPEYVGESFDAIVGYNSNGAIIHYKPEKETSKLIRPEGILLVDSGGQYEDGTTDITRTIALSTPDPEIKKHYTAVLMGHIALAQVEFPHGTKGIQLDILARQFLWSQGLNYGHGTGHGVGFFMNVHEPPQGIVGVWNQRGSAEMLPGSLTSNEPGFYIEGSHGIRIENLILTVPKSNGSFGPFYAFETVTLFPIDISLIEMSVFTQPYKEWLNDYHKRVYDKISPWLNDKEKDWLKKKCEKI